MSKLYLVRACIIEINNSKEDLPANYRLPGRNMFLIIYTLHCCCG